MSAEKHPVLRSDAPFVYPDGAALGDAVLQLDDEAELGVGFHVYRMPPGHDDARPPP